MSLSTVPTIRSGPAGVRNVAIPQANGFKQPPREMMYKAKARSVSRKRATDSIEITYMGRHRQKSEGDSPSSTTTATSRHLNRPTTRSIAASSHNKTETSFGSFGAMIKEVDNIGSLAKKDNVSVRKANKILGLSRLGVISSTKLVDEQLTLARLLTQNNEWSLNTCHAYITTILDNITSVDDRSRSIALCSLEAISISLPKRLVQFATVNNHHRIGTDVAAEERSEKARFCIQQLRELVKNRDVYYKDLDEESIMRLDSCMENLKHL